MSGRDHRKGHEFRAIPHDRVISPRKASEIWEFSGCHSLRKDRETGEKSEKPRRTHPISFLFALFGAETQSHRPPRRDDSVFNDIAFQLTKSVIETKEVPVLEVALANLTEHFIFLPLGNNTIMATTLQRNLNRSRPTKSNSARNKRQADHRKRLIALGMDEAIVARMNPKAVRDKLKYPAKVTKELAAAAAKK